MLKFLSWLGGLLMPASKQNDAIKAAYPATTGGGSDPVVSPSDKTPYQLAQTYLHTRETPGKDSNKTILGWLRRIWKETPSEDTPWCSAFVNAMAGATGYEESRSLAARSWLKVGESLTQRQARAGDVVVFWRGSRDAETGHVAFFDKIDEARGLIFVLGGNQSDEVNISSYPLARVLGFRRLRRIKNV